MPPGEPPENHKVTQGDKRPRSISTSSSSGNSIVITTNNNRNKQTKFPQTKVEIAIALDQANSLFPANLPLIVLKAYCPSDDWTAKDEAKVDTGMVVNGLYKQGGWVFVRTPLEKSGFIPFSFTEPLGVKENKDFAQQWPEPKESKSKSQSQSLSQSQKHRNDSELCDEGISTTFNPGFTSSKLESISVHTLPDSSFTEETLTNTIIETLNTTCQTDSFKTKSSNGKGLRLMPKNCSNVRIGTDDSVSFQSSGKDTKKDTAKLGRYKKNDQHHRGPRMVHYGSGISSMRARWRDPVMLQSTLSLSQLDKTDNSFAKDYSGPKFTVLFDYSAENENDLTVKCQDVVRVLNEDDDDWIYVRSRDGQEGFIPRSYAVNLNLLNLDPHTRTTYL